jgi:hypothetical protein
MWSVLLALFRRRIINSPMLARGGLFICFLLAAWAVGSRLVCAAPAAWLHEASGLRFPDSIEGKWLRKEQSATGKTAAVEYQSPAGWRVRLHVRPAPKNARGPTLLDGDARSDANAEFQRELGCLFPK